MSIKHCIILFIVGTLGFAWVLYCNTGARRVCSVVEVKIEQQCHTFAVCRVSDGGVTCWAIDTTDTILVHRWQDGDTMPSYDDINVFCSDLNVR